MLEVADIVRLHGTAYRNQYGNTLTPDRKRALRDIAACRTPFFGGHVYQCDHCQEKVFSYHSCRNRSCPKCHQSQTERWLSQQRGRLLPCSYFLVTFTLPAQLRPLARSHPRKIYGLLMKAAADAVTRRDLVYGSETDFSDLVWANVWMFVRNRRQECEHDGGISASINIPPTTLSIF